METAYAGVAVSADCWTIVRVLQMECRMLSIPVDGSPTQKTK